MNTEEGNKIIAEFMQEENISALFPTEPFVTEVRISYKQIEDLEQQGATVKLWYHDNWNKLMPVVSKCYYLCNDDQYPDEEVKLSEALLSCDLNELYPAVIQFIEWYNQTKNK